MNFAAAAHEVFNWVRSHPIDDVLLGVAAVIATVGSVSKYKEYRANRRRVEEILARLPKPDRVVIGKDQALEVYAPDGRLKKRIPFSTQEL